MMDLKKRIFNKLWYIKTRLKTHNKTKIFCIGFNKTGTTSLSEALKEMGFIVAPQRPAEYLLKDWSKRDFRSLYRFCKKSGQAFQDIPFSLPFTYIALDVMFPGSKFILTIRDDPDMWYESITKFHKKKHGKGKRIPTMNDLMESDYLYKGYAWEYIKFVFNTPNSDPYNKKQLERVYENHIHSVKKYFSYRKKDLLILNVAEKGAYQEFCDFLKIKTEREDFPWKKKTDTYSDPER